jgi:predicted Zn-dependent protease with MMP-like domain
MGGTDQRPTIRAVHAAIEQPRRHGPVEKPEPCSDTHAVTASAPPQDSELEQLLTSFDAAMRDEDSTRARAALAALTALLGDDDPDVLYAAAHVTWLDDGPEAAEPMLQQLVQQVPEHGDAHYDLASLAEERGDQATMVQHFLRVRALDANADKAAGIGTPADFDAIERVAREVLDALPEPFASRLSDVPVMIERRPERHIVEQGFDPRAFGLFDGPTHGVADVPAPTRIVLYACNLLAEFDDPEVLREQVEITVLHEVGHYFGLDEGDMERLGLD